MRALVTGGGGFLGAAIVERLLDRGWRVRSFSRGDYPALRKCGVQVIRGDLADTDAVARACAGCDIVFHVAAKAGIWGPRREFERANVIGTQNVLEACRAHDIPRLVYTSSPSVVFDGGDMSGVDESTPYPNAFKSVYSETKARAEQLVLAFNDRHATRVVTLRPHLIWGPRDNHIVPRLISRARAGALRQVGDGTNLVDTTYIDNAADAHLCAADALETNPAAAGRAYFISNGEPRPLWEIINAILACADLPPVTRRISHRAARRIGAVLEMVHTLLRLRREPRMTRFVADELATDHWFDIDAARRELGYEPRVSIDEGLRRLRAWLSAGESDPRRAGAAR
ncbi:MAG: NAD-dependent epimerase/dehydratase family protein [Planctomycetota bacterium]|nr:MAG: NAD-dependent epimerase/dehydratase family protein [Planctomycetota bacterium]